MIFLSGKNHFRNENQGGFVNDVDSEDEGDQKRNLFQSEFLGGAGEDDGDEIEDTEGDFSIQRQAVITLSVDESKAMLRRDKELERASAFGRHKEGDTQMKNYVEVFGNLLQLPLPEAPIQPRSHLAASLPFHIAANFQRAVAKEMRMLQQSNTIPQDHAEPGLDNLLELQRRNKAKD